MLGLLWKYIYLCRALVARSLNPKRGDTFRSRKPLIGLQQFNRLHNDVCPASCLVGSEMCIRDRFAKQSDFAALTVEFKSKDLSDAIEPNHAGIITPKRP